MRKLSRLLPLLLVLIANIIGFGVLYFSGDPADKTPLYYSLAVAIIVLISYAIILFASFGDDYLFLIVSMIFTIGIIALLRLNLEVAKSQIMFFYFGMVGFFVFYVLFKKLNFWDKKIMILGYIALSALLYIITLVFGVSSGGAKNWLNLGFIGIQPSEVIKILFILSLAGLYTYPYTDDNPGNLLDSWLNNKQKRQILIMLVAYMHLGFLILQREWGSALLYFMIYFSMQYIFGGSWKIFAANIVFAGTGAFAGVTLMEHIRQRIAIWQDPFAVADDLGYQIVQSLYAMASGGVTGAGIGQGYPEYIPLVKNDFIFAGICEELGMMGAIGVIMLFFMLFYRGIKIALRATNSFNKAVAIGISAMFGYQTFIIIGGVTKFIPLTGITLPFMSAGGSSLASCFIALALLQAISGRREELTDEI